MNNYLISIDGNYDTDFEAEFYLFKLQQIQFIGNLHLSKYYVNSSLPPEEIVGILNEIKEKLKKDNNFIMLVGGVAEPIIQHLESEKNIHNTFFVFDEVSRVYREIKQKCRMVNFLLLDKTKNEGLMQAFKKIDTMNISLGFDFKAINCEDVKLMDNYKEILDVLRDSGWNVPVLEK